MIRLTDKDAFHVHTYRCGHAGEEKDEEYIRKAIACNACGIWFSDHAPFPGDPFGHRMKYEQLGEYLDSLQVLKKKYEGTIDVHIGLETEYFPSFAKVGYYDELHADVRLDFLLLGQHMAEDEEAVGQYTFSWDKEKLVTQEYLALGKAVCEGIRSGYFAVVAHPDRVFRKRTEWDEGMTDMAVQLIEAAIKAGLPLEQNEASRRWENMYRTEFWELVPQEAVIIRGLDAHSTEEIFFP